MSVSEPEQAEPVHSERRMLVTGFACDITAVLTAEKRKYEDCDKDFWRD